MHITTSGGRPAGHSTCTRVALPTVFPLICTFPAVCTLFKCVVRVSHSTFGGEGAGGHGTCLAMTQHIKPSCRNLQPYPWLQQTQNLFRFTPKLTNSMELKCLWCL